jgi:acyl-CoA synthetase (AMP-forming)/AMP-acid ligase II
MSDFLIERFAKYADRTALISTEGTYSYAALHQRILEVKKQLTTERIQAGDTITLEADYSLNGIATLWALFSMKCIVAPISEMPPEAIEMRIRESNANHRLQAGDATVQCQNLDSKAEPHAYIQKLVKQQAAGLILFSSGSTGKPKAMVHDADTLLKSFAAKRLRNHRILLFLLFDHIGGLNTLFNGLASGACLVIPDSKSPDSVAATIAKEKVHLLPTSPTFLNLLLISEAYKKHDLSSLRFITYGTEPMPESLLARLKIAFPDAAFIQTFGTSETGITQTTSRSTSSTEIKIDATHTEYKIVGGELCLRSKTQILGYLNHEMSQFSDDGWFQTGDLVEELDGNYLKIIGRRQEMINVGGEKVTPSEVESVLLQMSEIADCIVYAEANTITGQTVAAEIVLKKANTSSPTKREIKNHCRKYLSSYKVPVRIHFLEEIPYSARFKKKRMGIAD